MTTVLFGSISTVADTSELQRAAFNYAFAQHGLDWNWEQEEYRTLLQESGGQGRIAHYAQEQGETVDVAAIHETKSMLFQRELIAGNYETREGVVELIAAAHAHEFKVGLVTTTSPSNVATLLGALAPQVQRESFDVVVDLGAAVYEKPDPASYRLALDYLGESAGDCVAIEDNIDGVTAAVAAGIACVAFPNANTVGHDFASAQSTVTRLDFTAIQSLIAQ